MVQAGIVIIIAPPLVLLICWIFRLAFKRYKSKKSHISERDIFYSETDFRRVNTKSRIRSSQAPTFVLRYILT